MFRVERIGKSRLEIQMSDRLDDESMRKVLDEIVAKSADIDNGTMLYDVIDYQLPTLSAIKIEFARLPSMLGLMKKFKKAAVLPDKRWLQKVTEFESLFFPNLQIKAFARDEVQVTDQPEQKQPSRNSACACLCGLYAGDESHSDASIRDHSTLTRFLVFEFRLCAEAASSGTAIPTSR